MDGHNSQSESHLILTRKTKEFRATLQTKGLKGICERLRAYSPREYRA